MKQVCLLAEGKTFCNKRGNISFGKQTERGGGEKQEGRKQKKKQWRQDRTRESWQVAALWRFIRLVRIAGCEYACTASSSVCTHKHTHMHTPVWIAAGVWSPSLLTGKDESTMGTVGFGVKLRRQQAVCLQMVAAGINIFRQTLSGVLCGTQHQFFFLSFLDSERNTSHITACSSSETVGKFKWRKVFVFKKIQYPLIMETDLNWEE